MRERRRSRRREPVPEPTAAATRVIVLVRAGCHLCADATAVAAGVCGARGVMWEEQDVDASAALRAAYTDHVPVTFVDGRRIAYWGLDPADLAAALDA